MEKSYWISSVKEDKKKYPRLQEKIDTEVCIIGAGLTGLTTAYYLAKAGKSVVVLERKEIAEGTTGNTTGKITSQHGLFYSYLLQSVGKHQTMQYLQANEQAIQNISKIIEEEKIDCDFEWQDNYVFSQSKRTLEKLKKEQEALEYIGFKNSEFVENINLPIKEKEDKDNKNEIKIKNKENNHLEIDKKIFGAIKFKKQAQFNSYKYGLGLAEKIKNMGGKILENSKVIDVKKKEENYEIVTEDGKVNCKYVVIASHYPIVNLPGFYFLKMYQETSYIVAVETKENLFDGMYISAEDNAISLRTAKYGNKRLLLIGGMSHKTGEKIDLKNSYKNLEEVAQKLYPGSKVLYRWNAEDCISLDKIPYIGEFSLIWPNVYVGTGYKKWGMTSSNVAANIITDKILGKENPYEDVFTSTRLKPIKNYKELGNMLKEVSYSEIINKLKKVDEHTKDVKQGEGKIVEVDGKKVGIYRDKKGKIYAIKPYCSHLGCELSWNNLENTWDCPCHGSRFTYEGKSIYEPTVRDLEVYYIEK